MAKTKKTEAAAALPQGNWKNRIVGYGEEDADQLLSNTDNWRIHGAIQQKSINGILDEVGWVQNVIVNKRTSEEWGADQNVETLVDGHLRVETAIARGERVPITYVDLTPNEERLILASIDPISAMAGTDTDKLTALLANITSSNADTLAALDAIAKKYDARQPLPTPADTEEVISRADELLLKWKVKRGQIWVCGDHRILCGDSTDPGDVALLMEEDRAVCMWTDPPYGVKYVGKTKAALTIQNDGAEDLDPFLANAFAAADGALIEGASIYVSHPACALSVTFGARFLAQGWRLHETLVWVKDSMVLGRSDYHYRHEPILFGYKRGEEGRQGRSGAGWYGDNKQTSVLEFDRPKSSQEHPTMKPIELVSYCLSNSAPKDGIVFDPFCGSGTTVIACQLLGMQGRTIELSEKYTSVILERLSLMGVTPELVS